MIFKLSNANSYFKVCLISYIASLVIFLGLLPLYACDCNDIPQGFVLGALVGLIPNLLLGIIEKTETEHQRSVGAIIVIIFRFLLIATTVALSALLYYKMECKIFNPFTVVGGYLVNTLVLTITILMSKTK